MNCQSLAVTLALSLATAVAAAAAYPAAAAAPEGKESCYGIALKGHNDCAAAGHSCAGQATMSYSPADFKYVKAGTCTSMKVHGHQGSLTAS